MACETLKEQLVILEPSAVHEKNCTCNSLQVQKKRFLIVLAHCYSNRKPVLHNYAINVKKKQLL